MLVLCDSGILLRLFEPTDPLHDDVRDSVTALQGRGDKLVTAPQNVAEFWNVCTRPAEARGGYGLSPAEAERRLQAVERTFSVLTELPSAYVLWRALIVTHAVLGKQVHDARLAALMGAHGITHILTGLPQEKWSRSYGCFGLWVRSYSTGDMNPREEWRPTRL